MLDYFYDYYIAQNYGPGYVATNIIFVAAAVLLLNPVNKSPRGVLGKLGEITLCWMGTVAYCSVYRGLLGHAWMDRSMMLLFLAVYAGLLSRYSPVTRLVRSCVFFACTMLCLPISEPVGELIRDYINSGYTWAEHLTSLIVAVLTALVVAFLRRFSTEELAFIPTFPVVVVTAVSALSTLLTLAGLPLGISRGYNVLQACCFWAIMLMTYYMFYTVSREYEQNLELMAVRHKEQLDEELFHTLQDSYEEIHQIRHEVKNHLAYIGALAEHGECAKLREYLKVVNGETEELFRFVECGNDVINAVMNHAIRLARSRGVEVESRIIVPPRLPYRETKLCSLLSNLLDNAIEASVRSGAERPVITVSIRPQQDYLFFHVTNPVRGDPVHSPQGLATTKEDRKLHGYGTKIIRNVAEHYLGSVKFDVREGYFIADVMLSLEGNGDGEAVSGDL